MQRGMCQFGMAVPAAGAQSAFLGWGGGDFSAVVIVRPVAQTVPSSCESLIGVKRVSSLQISVGNTSLSLSATYRSLTAQTTLANLQNSASLIRTRHE